MIIIAKIIHVAKNNPFCAMIFIISILTLSYFKRNKITEQTSGPENNLFLI
jgi:hypothetical protein